MPYDEIPSRPSDAGPEQSERPVGWRELLDAAYDCIRDTRSTLKSNNRAYILGCIERAVAMLEAAKEDLK